VANAQNNLPPSLSDDASISVLTCAPGEELYSVFGHTAIRVSDPVNELDLVFNYGTFDFNTPFFYLKFGHGNLDYLLSVAPFKRFMREYFMSGRSVWEQQLALSGTQKENLFEALIVNAQPANRAYRYDFFYDNCATRVADIILDQYPPQKIEFTTKEASPPITFRDAIHPYLSPHPWTKLGIDLILGAPADAETDSVSIMFLPDYLMAQFSGIRINSGNKNDLLVSETNVLLDFSESIEDTASWWSPSFTLWLVFVLVLLLSLAEKSGNINLKLLDIFLFSFVAVLGFVIFYIGWISNHQVTSPNWNILWANPLWILLITNVTRRFRKFICLLEGAAMLIFVGLMFTGVQFFPSEVFPIILILMIRGILPFCGKIKITPSKN
jgi:hypothetical protein